ncbi:HAD family hydrolase [Paenibacillus sp. F411]|uniref:Haloacid dehalogenase domain protein hydrolase n=1 Tax=Paenibacillus algicola TaxID=2565926 RepID=A0A4P8XQE4_9BACL|nr:HAD-IA family hydrolase [Paenibacillus sp. F411]MBO2943087.1 HAD family hydrolase [Paenibacillus sp. F411]QCT02659.1 Haloacid dehalogenase domain protein hydrolase [Paenibacillus algicola]
MHGQGIIFDMDNTLLQSRIDFESMKSHTYQFCVEQGLLSPECLLSEHTTSTLIEEAKASGLMTEERLAALWGIAERYETEGMLQAELEPGAKELLQSLKGKYHLVVVTNNATQAAIKALKNYEIQVEFEYVVGREYMEALKPAPGGFQYVLNQYHHLKPSDWLSVGDSWIDGKASQAAGIPFVAYRSDPVQLKSKGVLPLGVISHLAELPQWL